MLWHCLWATILPLAVLGQTYYINFVFNNNRYNSGQDSVQRSKEAHSGEESENESQMSFQDGKTMESISRENSHHESNTKHTTFKHHIINRSKVFTDREKCDNVPSNTDEECEESVDASEIEENTTRKLEIDTTTSPNEITTSRATTAATTETESVTQSKESIEEPTIKWLSPTPHPPEFLIIRRPNATKNWICTSCLASSWPRTEDYRPRYCVSSPIAGAVPGC